MRPTWRLDSRLGEHEAFGDLGVGEAARDLGSTSRSRAVSAASGSTGARRGRGRQPVRRSASSSRRVTLGATTASPRRDRADAREQVGRRHVLEQEAARPGTQAGEDVLVEVERRQDEHARAAAGGDDPARGLDAVDPRHAHVHEHDVRIAARRPAARPRRRRRPRPRRRGRPATRAPCGSPSAAAAGRRRGGRSSSRGRPTRVDREPRVDAPAAGRRRARFDRAAVDRGALAHAAQPAAAGGSASGAAAAVVARPRRRPRRRRSGGDPARAAGPACLSELVSASWTRR